MFISFYITDSKDSLIFQHLLSSSSPPFSHLWTKILSVCPEIISNNQEDNITETDDEQYLNRYTRSVHSLLGKDLEIYKYHSQKNDINYFCLTSRSKGQASIESCIFLEDMDRLLMEYFEKDQLTVNKLINNYDRLSMIFYMCIDAGEPTVGKLHENMIKRMVPIRSDFSKIINSTANSIQKAVQRQPGSKGARLLESSSIRNDVNHESDVVPWRAGNLKFTDNEIYVDMIERVHLVYSKKRGSKNKRYGRDQMASSRMEMVYGSIGGIVNFRSHISDNPTVQIDLDLAGNYIGIPSLHRCVEVPIAEFDNIDKLTFVPPDGRFTLMEYNIDLDVPQANKSAYNYGTVGMLSIDFQDQLGVNKDEFEITVNISSSTKVSHIRNLRLEVEFEVEAEKHSEGGSETKDCRSQETDITEYKVKVLRNTHGRFENDMKPGKGTWIFDKETVVGALPVLRACVENIEKPNTSNSSFPVKVRSIVASHDYVGQLASGIQAKAINITSGVRNLRTLKLFKGVKYYTETKDFEIRG